MLLSSILVNIVHNQINSNSTITPNKIKKNKIITNKTNVYVQLFFF